jgi:hypothetical protein
MTQGKSADVGTREPFPHPFVCFDNMKIRGDQSKAIVCTFKKRLKDGAGILETLKFLPKV